MEAATTQSPTEDPGFRQLARERPDLGEWCALLTWRGSIAHGTYVPPEDPDAFDDRDLIGVVIPPTDHHFGLREYGSRGTQEVKYGPWDVVLYDHRKALRLLAKGNPNMLAMLWVPDEMHVVATGPGNLLIAQRRLFSTKRALPAFLGYAQGQLKKMRSGSYQGYMGEKRKELFDRYGYDVKQASHLIRILRQGVEFMVDGRMTVLRPDASELLEIKQGGWSLDRVLAVAGDLEQRLKEAGDESTLPEEPDWDAVNRLAVNMALLQHPHPQPPTLRFP